MQTTRVFSGVLAVMLAVSPVFLPAVAQPAGMNGIRLGEEVVPAPEGYEPVTAKYVAARATDLYISPFIWGGKVIGAQLKPGQQVEVLAKPKGYDWILVSKNGAGIGYVPLSVLSPANR
jgi:hypothetical protein